MSRPWMTRIALGCALGAFGLIWIANLRYPLIADPVGYAHLGKSFWETGTYQIRGKPDDVFVPGFSIASYPFQLVAGMNAGTKLASLVFGMLAMLVLFAYVRRESENDSVLAIAVIALLPLCHTITWQLGVGNADTMYAFLFFASLVLYLAAEKRPGLYLPLGLLLGITMLTRYMGVALLPIIGLHALLQRRKHLTLPSFWLMGVLALAIFALWFLRHRITFGTWTTWHMQFQFTENTTLWQRLLNNVSFYVHPLHSIGFFFPFFVLGWAARFRAHLLSTIALPLSLLLCYTYPTPTSRFLVTTIPFMLLFSVEGMRTLARWTPSYVVVGTVILATVGQIGMTCAYSAPRCSALLQEWRLPGVPLGILQEQLESVQLAVDWINVHATTGATVISPYILADDLPIWQSSGRLRADLHLALRPSCSNPTYTFSKSTPAFPVHTTAISPPTFVSLIEASACGEPLPYDPEARYW